jgi:hypothetical protein
MWLRHTLARVLGSLRAYAATEAAPLRNASRGRINREIWRSGPELACGCATRSQAWILPTWGGLRLRIPTPLIS